MHRFTESETILLSDDLVGAAQEEVCEGVQACLVHRCVPRRPPVERDVQLLAIARPVGVWEMEYYLPGILHHEAHVGARLDRWYDRSTDVLALDSPRIPGAIGGMVVQHVPPGMVHATAIWSPP